MTDEASPRVRAALPRGLVDRAPADIAAAGEPVLTTEAMTDRVIAALQE